MSVTEGRSGSESPVIARMVGAGYDYGRHCAIGSATADILPGITGLLGLNGVGKTTLLRMLTAVTRPHRGSVEIFGIDTASRSVDSVRRRVGYLPQGATWTPSLRVREFLQLFAWLRHLSPRDQDVRVGLALERTGLGPLAERRLGALSGGEHRRAMLAQSLLADPGFLVLDEPTAGLDPRQRVELRRVLTSVAEEQTAVIVSTHLLEDVSTIADRVIVLAPGQVVFDGTPATLAGTPGERLTATALERGFLRVIDDDGIGS